MGSNRQAGKGAWVYGLLALLLVTVFLDAAEPVYLLGLPVLWLFWRQDALLRRIDRLEAEQERLAAERDLARARQGPDLRFDAEELDLEPGSESAPPAGAEPASPIRTAAGAPSESQPVPEARPASAPGAAVQPGRSRAGDAGWATPDEDNRQSNPPLANPLLDAVTGFFTDGNVVARIGILVLFFGIAFLLKYAADNALLPIELRLAGATLGGLGLLLLGWRLRERRGVYALLLQGAGIGVVYLVVYASARLYELLPLGLAFAIMLGVVLLSAALAVLQNARHLAAFGAAGGFLAPILTAAEAGNHILLFSYYACLNLGILAVAWYRAWRELNLLGFVFTFVIGGAWGYFSYRPELLGSTVAFIALFAVMYVSVAVLFAHRAPFRLRGYVDSALVFGVPLAGFSLLAALLQDRPLSLALAALIAGGGYVLLARGLWRRQVEGMRMLTEALLAVGVVLLSMAVPLALDGTWSAALWAAEGAGLVWIGLGQQRRAARWFGLLLQLGAAALFLEDLHPGAEDRPFLNPAWLGSLLIALAGLLSAWLYARRQRELPAAEYQARVLVLAWGLAWWFGGDWLEFIRLADSPSQAGSYILLGNAISFALMLWLRDKIRWTDLDLPLALFPASLWAQWLLAALLEIPAVSGPGWLAWPLALTLAWYGLWRQREHPRAEVMRWLQASMFWLLPVLFGYELHARLADVAALGPAWALAALPLPALVLTWLVAVHERRLAWPIGADPAWYQGTLLVPLVYAVLAWVVLVSASAGDPAPIAYVPLFNPLEMTGLAALALAGFRLRALGGGGAQLPDATDLQALRFAVAAAGFVLLTCVVARSVHHSADVLYDFEALFRSRLLQTALSLVWTLLALVVTVLASRGGNRRLWFAGAGLLLVVVIKLFAIDLGNTGTIERIVSFILVGLLMLAIGYFSPIPPRTRNSA